MTRNDEVHLLSNYLLNLATGKVKPLHPNFGLCTEWIQRIPVLGVGMEWLSWIDDAIENWPEHSGNYTFPVPPGQFLYSPVDAYTRAGPFELWEEGEYAEARKRLCKWLSEEILKCLSE